MNKFLESRRRKHHGGSQKKKDNRVSYFHAYFINGWWSDGGFANKLPQIFPVNVPMNNLCCKTRVFNSFLVHNCLYDRYVRGENCVWNRPTRWQNAHEPGSGIRNLLAMDWFLQMTVPSGSTRDHLRIASVQERCLCIPNVLDAFHVTSLFMIRLYAAKSKNVLQKKQETKACVSFDKIVLDGGTYVS